MLGAVRGIARFGGQLGGADILFLLATYIDTMRRLIAAGYLQ